jgi:cytochrome P450
MPVARTLPVRALAAALGLQSSQAERAAALTGKLCDTFAPRLTGAETPSATAGSATGGGSVADAPQSADEAASELCALLSATVPLADTETIAAAASILFQARDATAALIGLAALALADAPVTSRLPVGQLIDSVLRREAPVQCTRRMAAADSTVGGARLPAGADVWIFIAAAERGREVPATFGSGPHGCPGATHAAAVAEVVIEVLSADGWRPVPGQRVEMEDRPNICCPRAVQVRRS